MNEIRLRASSLNNYLGCPRRAVHHYHNPSKQIGAGAIVGTLTHKIVEADVKGEEAPDLDKIITEEKSRIEVLYNKNYPNEEAMKKVAKIFAKNALDTWKDDILINCSVEKTFSKVELEQGIDPNTTFYLSGTADYIDADNNIIDLKTGMMSNAYFLQLACYSYLNLLNGGEAPEELIVLHTTQSSATTIRLKSKGLDKIYKELDRAINAAILAHIGGGLPTANPNTFLCTSNFCELHAAKACVYAMPTAEKLTITPPKKTRKKKDD